MSQLINAATLKSMALTHNQSGELHLFILWEAARSCETRILDNLKQAFEIVAVREVGWSAARVSDNFTRFYGQKLPPGSFKEEHCGKGPFLAVVVRDRAPRYEKRQTSKGERSVNTNTFDAKQRYREWTGGGHRVHATDSESETCHDFAMLFGMSLSAFAAARPRLWDGKIECWNQDLTGAEGWSDLKQLFSVLNETVRYLVLRKAESLLDPASTEERGDIDVLTDATPEIVFVANGKQISNLHHTVRVGGQELLFEFQYVGDGNFDPRWQEAMLSRRTLLPAGVYAPSAEDHFYSLLYHALVHKPKMAEAYVAKLTRMAAELKLPGVSGKTFAKVEQAKRQLDIFLQLHGFAFWCPNNLSVHFNEPLFRMAPAVIIQPEAVRGLPAQRHSSTLLSARFLAEHAGTRYFSVVHEDEASGGVLKQTTGDLAWRDAQLLRRLAGPHFPRVLDARQDNGWSVAVFERIAGHELTQVIPEIATTPKSLAQFFGECLDILEALQSARITHRDIQTHNLLVRDGHPVLIDFGWAIAPDAPCFDPSGLGDAGRPPDGSFCDVFAMGKVFAACVPANSPMFTPLISAMTSVDPGRRITSAAALRKLLHELALPAAWELVPAFAATRRHIEPLPWQGDVQALMARANAFAANGDFAAAGFYLETGRLLHPQSSELHTLSGMVLMQQGSKAAAAACFAEACRLDPSNVAAGKFLASALIDQRRLREAVGVLKHLNQLHPNDTEVLCALANCLAHLGDIPPAVLAYQRVLELNPANAPARQALDELADDSNKGQLTPQVSIVIPVYGNLKYTTMCLDAITRNTPESIAYEIIVVDDASSDGTQEFLQAAPKFYTRLRSVRLNENSGFSSACNAGAAAARGEFVLFLNNDTEPCAGWLEGMLNVFQREPLAGVVGSLLLFPRRSDNAAEPDRVQHCGIVFNGQKEALHLYKFCLTNQPFVRQTREYQAVTAACMMLPRDVFNSAGGFSKNYLNGGEDLDLCFKIRAQGRKVIVAADSVVRHHESVSVKSGHNSGNANYRRFLESWGGQIQADEELFYERDGVRAAGKMRIAMVTPLRPLKTGVADYVEELLPALAQHGRVDFFVDDLAPDNPNILRHHFVHSLHDIAGADWTYKYDAVIYHVGNNRFHGEIYKLAANRPGIVVLHEYDCRGCGNENSSRRHLRGLLRRAQAVIVHNEHSRQLLRREFPELPAFVIPHLLSHKALQTDTPENARARIGLPKDAFIIVSLGLVQLHKRNHITLEAFAKFSRRHANALLLLAGEAPDPAFRNYLNKQIQDHGLQNKVRITGWLSDEQFFDCLSAADVTVNLRYPARGEESGSLTRILGCGKPAIVSNFAQFADIPDDCVIKVNFENEVEELIAAWEQLLNDPAQREARSARAREFYRAQNDVGRVAALYAEVCRRAGRINEATLQLRQPFYQFDWHTLAQVVWDAPVFAPKDQSRPLILALDKLKVPVCVRAQRNVDSEIKLINSEDVERLKQLTALDATEGFIQVYAGDPTQFQRAAGARAVVAWVQTLDAGEIAAWSRLPASEFWAVSDPVRNALIQAGVDAEKITVVPAGVPLLSYGATVNELRPSGLFRFICVTDWSAGSGWDATLRAFLKEFGGQEVAQLIFKNSMTHLSLEEKNKLFQQALGGFFRDNPEFKPEQFRMVNTDNSNYPDDYMASFYCSGNALVQPTQNGVGCRAVLEASALGLPVITTELGQLEKHGEKTTPFIVRTLLKNGRTVVDDSHLRQLMRQLLTRRLESQLPGIRARQQILAARTWEAIAEQAAIRLAGLLDPAPASTPDANFVGAPQPQPSTGAAAPVGENLRSERPQPAAPIAALSCQLRWQSPIFDPSGYADESRYLLRSLQRHAPVRLEPIARLSKKFYDEMDRGERADLERMMATPLAKKFIQLTIAPAYALKREAGAGYAIGRSTFETDRLPMEWVAACNNMDEVWVPTAFNVETFKRAGVRVPIHIVPQGVDSDRFHPGLKPLPIAGRRRFAFLSVFEWIHRKGWDVLLRAWAETFTADEDVCLLIRSYLPNVTEGRSSTAAINERIDQFLQKELGRTRASVAPIIVLGEQLPQLDMPRLYASADCFVLPTRGEGWGRPYIEAMACGLPVIGTNWGGQLAFMHEGNSLLLDIEGLEIVDAKMEFPFYRGHQWARPSVAHLKQLLRRVVDNPAGTKKLGETAAAEARTKWNWENAGAAMRTQLAVIEARLAAAKPGPRAAISWEGSFLDHGSLSHVNRELVGALQDFPGPQIKCVTNGGPVAADAATVWPQLVNEVSATPAPDAAITVRHAWPPNWKRPRQGKLVVIQPWEFGVLPETWVKQARDVDEFWIPSEYVRRVYVESGVPAEKVFVVPNGVDAEKFNPQAAPLKLATQKKFKFLFVGGTIGRKGPDLLLSAYLKNFTAADDVCLVIKDFGGKSVYNGQTFEAQIRAAQSVPNAPEILYLNEELPPNQLPGLYTACDCFVLPYRGEGFGLPALEAMACGLPVLVTAGGATDDFIRDEFAYRIPATKRIIGREVSGMKLAGDGWLLEPNLAALGEKMRHVFNHPAEARERGQLASRHAHLHCSWKHSAAIAAQRIRELSAIPITPAKPAAKPMPAELPEVARVGQLAEARELFGQKKLEAAWNATTVAIAQRPFHPEAFLLLAEITLAAGDGKSAKLCAQRARNCTPGWQAPKQFLSKPLKRAAQPEWLVLPESISNFKSQISNRLSVCLIVKNEEKFLAQCLKSVRGFASQIVVVDTGSTDRTVEIAREFGAQIYSFAWCDDFAAARNAALEHATGDWVLMLDADEELPAAQHAKLLADMKNSAAIAFRLPLANAGKEIEGRSFVPRLFRNAPGVFFRGRIHEQVFPSLLAHAKQWGLKTALGSAELLHHGYTKEMVHDRNKVERNLKLLRAAIEENPTDVNLVMNLGLELVRSDDLPGGIEKYREAYEMMSAQPAAELVPELREVLLTQFTSQLYKIRGHEEAVQVLNSPLARRGGLTASLHFALGLAHFELKQFREAADQMRQCLNKRKQPGLTPINTDILTAAPQHCLALSLAKLGDLAGTEKAFVAALAETGHVEAAKLDYAKFLRIENRPVDALHQLHEIVTANARNFAAWRLGAEIALAKPEFLEFARDWTGEAFKALPENPVIATQRAEALMLNGDPVAAAGLWENIWRSEPEPRALAALILCEIAIAQTAHAPNADDEQATSRAFIEWYQKLIAASAQSLTGRIGERLDQLSDPLPSAAQMIGAALSEADVPAEV